MNRPRWRWLLWRALNWLHVRVSWRPVDRAWSWAILPDWLGDYEPPIDGEEAPW